ncbi:MAG: response regulator [Deltaproteobacteria bacterium]
MQKRILIIDDERDIRDVAEASLELVGRFAVVKEASGAAGLARARREQPDAISLDVMMPEMDGYETLKQLKEDDSVKAIPAILLTAKVQGPLSGQTAEAAGVLFKPFDPMLLPAQIASILGWQHDEGS